MNNYYPIIGIAGKAGSGKNTAADYLAKNYKGAIIALADPFKRFLFQCGTSEEALWGPSELRNDFADICYTYNQFYENCKQLSIEIDLEAAAGDLYDCLYGKKMRIRSALQLIGDSWGRHWNKEGWINYCINKANLALSFPSKYDPVHGLTDHYSNYYNCIIIPDLRYRNEILAVKKTGGLVLKIEKDTDNKLNHISETELDTVPDFWYDGIVYNNYSPETLESHLEAYMEIAYGR